MPPLLLTMNATDPYKAAASTLAGASSAHGGLLLVTDVRFWREAIGSQRRVAELIRLLPGVTDPVHVLYLGRPNEQDWRILRESTDLARVQVADGSAQLPAARRILLPIKAASVRTTAGGVDWAGGMAAVCSSKVRSLRRRVAPHAALVPRLEDHVNPVWAGAFVDAVERLRPATILVEYLRLTYLIDALSDAIRASVRTVVDTHDVMWRRDEAFRRSGLRSDLQIDAATEAGQLRKYDAVIAIQAADAAEFRRLTPGSSVHVVHHPHAIDPLPLPDGETLEVAFVASGMASNVEAMEYFMQQAWPLMPPDVQSRTRVAIYGGVCDKLQRNRMPAGIELRGFVDDVRDAYRRAAVVLNPVRAGGGLKIKTVEALCYGRCLVTTAEGAEGLEDGAGVAFLMANDAVGLAARICDAIRHPEQRAEFANRAIDYARARFEFSAVRRQLAAAISRY